MTPQAETARGLWERLFGAGQIPSLENFEIWTTQYPDDVVRHGFVKTAIRNQEMHGGMTLEHRIRFASRVMWTRHHDPQKSAGQRSQR